MAMKGHYDMDEGHGYEPHYQQGMTKGMYTYCYVNGDEFNVPKKILVNPKRDRTFNAFLDYATRVLNPRFGAVRNIYTPEGRHRVRRFEDMHSEGKYVACGQEPYKKLDRPYTQIPTDSAKRQRHRNHYRNRSEDRIVPARHNKTFENIQPKYNTVNTQSCKISVFLNREFEKPPLRVTLDPLEQSAMEHMKKAVRKKCEESYFRFDKLYTMDGREVNDVRQVESDGLYVAVDQFCRFEHGEYTPHGKKSLSVPLSPRYKFTETKYLWKDKSSLNGPVNGRHRTLPPIESKKHSPDHSVSSYPETRKRNQVNGVPVKAAKHTKRTPGRQADYDKDEGGVFKAKGQNRDTRGAKEVRDTGDTKVDLPIDQVRAEEVKDERIRKEKQNKDSGSKGPKPSGNVIPPIQKDNAGQSDPKTGNDAKPVDKDKDNKGLDSNKPEAGKDTKTSASDTSKPPVGNAKPQGDSKPADNKPAPGDAKPPGDSKPTSDNKPPAGDAKAPASDNKPPAGDTKAPASDNKPPAGDAKAPASDNKPTVGGANAPNDKANAKPNDNATGKSAPGENKGPAGDNKPPADNKPLPNVQTDSNANT